MRPRGGQGAEELSGADLWLHPEGPSFERLRRAAPRRGGRDGNGSKPRCPGEHPESLLKRQQGSGIHPHKGTLDVDPQPDGKVDAALGVLLVDARRGRLEPTGLPYGNPPWVEVPGINPGLDPI